MNISYANIEHAENSILNDAKRKRIREEKKTPTKNDESVHRLRIMFFTST